MQTPKRLVRNLVFQIKQYGVLDFFITHHRSWADSSGAPVASPPAGDTGRCGRSAKKGDLQN